MPKDYLDFRLFRFQLLSAALDVRQALHDASDSVSDSKDSAVSSSVQRAEFAGMSEAEFHGRLHLMTEMRGV